MFRKTARPRAARMAKTGHARRQPAGHEKGSRHCCRLPCRRTSSARSAPKDSRAIWFRRHAPLVPKGRQASHSVTGPVACAPKDTAFPAAAACAASRRSTKLCIRSSPITNATSPEGIAHSSTMARTDYGRSRFQRVGYRPSPIASPLPLTWRRRMIRRNLHPARPICGFLAAPASRSGHKHLILLRSLAPDHPLTDRRSHARPSRASADRRNKPVNNVDIVEESFGSAIARRI